VHLAADGEFLALGHARQARSRAVAVIPEPVVRSKRPRQSDDGDDEPESKREKTADHQLGRRRKHLHGADLEEKDRLERTVFVGNVPIHVSIKVMKRIVVSALLGLPVNDEVVQDRVEARRIDAQRQMEAASKAPTAAKEDDDDGDDVEDGEASAPAASTRATATAPPKDAPEEAASRREAGLKVESIRFRSVPLAQVATSKKGGHRLQRKAAFSTRAFSSNTAVGASMNAYVVLVDDESAAKVCEGLHGAVVMGHHLRTDMASSSASDSSDHKRTVFVGHVPFTATEEDLRMAFASSLDGGEGCIDSVRIPRDRVTNRSKGVAYVRFVTAAPVAEALALGSRGMMLGGTKLLVVPCKRAPPKSQEPSRPKVSGGAERRLGIAPKPAVPRNRGVVAPAHMGVRAGVEERRRRQDKPRGAKPHHKSDSRAPSSSHKSDSASSHKSSSASSTKKPRRQDSARKQRRAQAFNQAGGD
jgi:hypothetical protein